MAPCWCCFVYYMYLSRVGEGVHKLVSVIRAQHQAWSERLAARASLLQSTISQMEEGAATAPPFPTSPAEQSEAGSTRHSFPAPRVPAHEHFQEEQAAMHTHPSVSAHRSEVGSLRHHSRPSPPLQMPNIQDEERPTMLTQPSLSFHHDGGRALHQHSQSSPPSQSEGRALNHYHAPLPHNQAGGGVRQSYPLPTLSSQDEEKGDNKVPPSLLPHGTGVKEGGPQVLAPGTSRSHHDSLSIFTLSTRYDGDTYIVGVHVIACRVCEIPCIMVILNFKKKLPNNCQNLKPSPKLPAIRFNG